MLFRELFFYGPSSDEVNSKQERKFDCVFWMNDKNAGHYQSRGVPPSLIFLNAFKTVKSYKNQQRKKTMDPDEMTEVRWNHGQNKSGKKSFLLAASQLLSKEVKEKNTQRNKKSVKKF